MALPDLGAPVFAAVLWSEEAALTRYYEAVCQRDPAKLIRTLDRAYDGGDLKSTVIAGMALAQSDAFRPKDANNIVPALIKVGRFAEALSLLEHPSVRDLEDYARFYLLTRVLGGMGRLDEALDAADKTLSLRPDCAKTPAFREALATAIAVHGHPEPRVDPTDAMRLARLFEAQGLRSSAQWVLERIIVAEPVAGDVATAGWLDAVELALPLLAPDRVRAFLLANEGRFDDEERRQALLTVCEAMLGRPAPPPSPGEGRAMSMARAFAMEASGDLDGAIPVLAALSRHHADRPPRRALARCVGLKVLDIVKPRFDAPSRRRIVNLVPFYNEFTMLQMRLHEMADWVDEFVIVEAAQTFTGLDKPLSFQARKAEFAPFADKIIHVVVDHFPPYINTAWSRDYFQRDMAVQAIAGRYGANDLILLTDADEIVDRRAIEGFVGDFAGLEMSMFRYFLNYRPTRESAKRTLITSSILKAAYLEQFGSSYLRFDLTREKFLRKVIPNAGWHFTSVTNSAGVSQKMHSSAHTEHTRRCSHDEAHYDDLLGQIRQGTPQAGWERCDIDETYPAFVRERTQELADLLL